MAKKKALPLNSQNPADWSITSATGEIPINIVVPTPITELSVDFPSEGLNNMANKINELIQAHNAKIS